MKLAVMALAWIGTWATAPQPYMPGDLETYHDETVRLIVHVSAGGPKVRIRVSNVYGDKPLTIGAAHIAHRTRDANVDPMSDRPVLFQGHATATVPAHGTAVSDPVDLQVQARSDLAVSLYLPGAIEATTSHLLALQTSYVAAGNATGAGSFTVVKTIDTWPFLTGIDVAAADRPAIAVIGSSTTDGDGSTQDANQRWPDVLAGRLGNGAGVLNLGIIGNRLLQDSPAKTSFGHGLGESVLARYDRDVLGQPGVRFIVVCIGVNDIAFPGSFTPADEAVTSQNIIDGYRQLITRAHAKGIRIYMTTIPPFENARYPGNEAIVVYTPQKESVRNEVNDWIRSSHEFDAMIDFDAVLRDPDHPSRLLPKFDSGDHIHCNDAGYAATADAVPLGLFGQTSSGP